LRSASTPLRRQLPRHLGVDEKPGAQLHEGKPQRQGVFTVSLREGVMPPIRLRRLKEAYVIGDACGFSLGYVYLEDESGRATQTRRLSGEAALAVAVARIYARALLDALGGVADGLPYDRFNAG
jgi:hypothetical protein